MKCYKLFWLSIGIIYISTWILQEHLLFNWDVSWILHGTKRIFIDGGSYLNNYVESNPPLILYISYLPVFVSQYFNLNTMIVFQLYVGLLATFSLALCLLLVKKIFIKSMWVGLIFLTAIAFVFFIVPMADFGQREHLMIIFIMPYLLSVMCRISSIKINSSFLCLIGLLAGIGFAIKPYFLFMLVFVEIYYKRQKMNSWANVRIETVAIMMVFFLYFLSVIFIFPDYVFILVPLLGRVYAHGFNYSWTDVLFDPSMFFCLTAIIFYFIQNKKYPYQILSSILFYACLGCIFSYIAQRTPYTYHYYPMIAISVLLALLAIISLLFQHKLNFMDYFFIATIFLGVFSYHLYFIKTVYYDYATNYTKTFTPLINDLKELAKNKSVYFFTSNGDHVFPIVDYAEVSYDSRLHGLLFMFDGEKQHKLANHIPLSIQERKDEQFFLNIITKELQDQKPDFVLVDILENKTFFSQSNFSYIDYFSKDSNFNLIWKKYRYLKVIQHGNGNSYKFAVFTRLR